MKIFTRIIPLLVAMSTFAQNGTLLERETLDLLQSHELKARIYEEEDSLQLKSHYTYLEGVTVQEITYESDGNKVKGYLAFPKKHGKYPSIIYNRGGNLDFGSLNIYKAAFILARAASWGYVVVASQYRGNGGGTGGRDEFGGAEVNDILNLLPLLQNEEKADSTNIGLYGWSRGGMMTYLTLTRDARFKAAVVGGGLSDLHMMMESRPVMEEVYEDLIPNYKNKKQACLEARSAIKFVAQLSKQTPILMLHGTSDWRVVPEMALELSHSFIQSKIPHRLVMLEGGDHGLNEFDTEVDMMVKQWFDSYLKNNKPLPNLEPHGR